MTRFRNPRPTSVIPAQAGIPLLRGTRRALPTGDAMQRCKIAFLLFAFPALAAAHGGGDHQHVGVVQLGIVIRHDFYPRRDQRGHITQL